MELTCYRIVNKETGKALSNGKEVQGIGHIYHQKGTARNSLEYFVKSKNFRLRFINDENDYEIKKYLIVDCDDILTDVSLEDFHFERK